MPTATRYSKRITDLMVFRQAIADLALFPFYDCEFPAFYGWLVIGEEKRVRNYDGLCVIKTGLPDCVERILVPDVVPEWDCEEQAAVGD